MSDNKIRIIGSLMVLVGGFVLGNRWGHLAADRWWADTVREVESHEPWRWSGESAYHSGTTVYVTPPACKTISYPPDYVITLTPPKKEFNLTVSSALPTCGVNKVKCRPAAPPKPH